MVNAVLGMLFVVCNVCSFFFLSVAEKCRALLFDLYFWFDSVLLSSIKQHILS